jgi:hypothetical protein
MFHSVLSEPTVYLLVQVLLLAATFTAWWFLVAHRDRGAPMTAMPGPLGSKQSVNLRPGIQDRFGQEAPGGYDCGYDNFECPPMPGESPAVAGLLTVWSQSLLKGDLGGSCNPLERNGNRYRVRTSSGNRSAMSGGTGSGLECKRCDHGAQHLVNRTA